jgi:hypothetical protein
MQASFVGGAWIIGSSYGVFRSDASQKLPEIDKLFLRIPTRFGRFDDFTKFGFIAVGLALQDAGWTDSTISYDTGLIISTQFDVMQTDLTYYATTIDQNALLSSPNLFSYTLPVAVIGECAVFFHLTGPTFCIGDDGRGGMRALETALILLQGKQVHRMIVAWIETPPDQLDSTPEHVSCAIVLESKNQSETHRNKTVEGIVNGGVFFDGKPVTSLFGFFAYLDISARKIGSRNLK